MVRNRLIDMPPGYVTFDEYARQRGVPYGVVQNWLLNLKINYKKHRGRRIVRLDEPFPQSFKTREERARDEG